MTSAQVEAGASILLKATPNLPALRWPASLVFLSSLYIDTWRKMAAEFHTCLPWGLYLLGGFVTLLTLTISVSNTCTLCSALCFVHVERQLAILQPRFHHHTTIGPKRKSSSSHQWPLPKQSHTWRKISVITMEKQCKCCNNNGAGAVMMLMLVRENRRLKRGKILAIGHETETAHA